MGKKQSTDPEPVAHWETLDIASAELARARAVVDLLYCASIDSSGTVLETLDQDTFCSVMSGLMERIDKAKGLIDEASGLHGPAAA